MQDPARPTFTFFHASGASRIDRVCLKPELSTQKNRDTNPTCSFH
jgi:hypothetical protein